MMRCLACGGATLTLETRQRLTGIYRRRACARCGARFSTIERVASNPQPPSRGKKPDGAAFEMQRVGVGAK